MDMYPQHRYLNWFNVIEITFCILSLLPLLGLSALTMLIYVWTVECLCEATDAFYGPHSRHLRLSKRVFAAFLSPVVKNVVDLGHFAYWARRGRIDYLRTRFDWFVGVHPGVISGERQKFLRRLCLWLVGITLIINDQREELFRTDRI